MRTGTSGSLKIWVNDVLTTSVSEERNCDLDIYISKIKLNKGFNRILVQIGQNEISNANFLLRLTDENGNQITGISSQPEYAAYQKSAEKNDNPELLPFFAEEYFIEKIKMEPDNYLDKILLAEVYLRNDKAYEATKVLKSLGDKAAISSFVMYRLAEAYSRAKNQTDYDKEMESIKNTDPESFYALELLYNEAINSEKYIDADSICSKVKRLYGTNETTDQWDINIAVKQKDNQRVIDLGKQLYKKYPDNVNYMRWVLSIPFLDQTILNQIRKKLIDTFGGEFSEIVIGGAPLNAEVEEFFHKIKFPFTVGYGMLGQAVTLVESSLPEHQDIAQEVIEKCLPYTGNSVRLGITGVPGAGKSTFIEALGTYLVRNGHKLAVLAIDPSSERSKGSILGDKTRMEELSVAKNAFIRPSPSAGSLGGVARKTRESIVLCEAAGFDTIFVETVGVGQSETAVHSMSDQWRVFRNSDIDFCSVLNTDLLVPCIFEELICTLQFSS